MRRTYNRRACVKHHCLLLQDKTALVRAVPTALQWIANRLQNGQRVAINSSDGIELPLCVALASVLARFSPTPAGDWIPSKLLPLSELPDVQQSQCGNSNAHGASGSPGNRLRDYASDCDLEQIANVSLDKSDFRRALAFVSSFCPLARPTARMLKQVSIALHVGGSPPADRKPAPRGNLKHTQLQPVRDGYTA